MWEWSHAQAVQNVRPSGVFAKVNRVRFTAQGNKFGACDGDGNVSLWQASNASQPFFVSNLMVFIIDRVQFCTKKNRFIEETNNFLTLKYFFIFQNMQCHSKQTSDFVYQGACSSLFCTAGFSSDGKNVALWDTLMPHKRCQVAAFNFHESGASAILHAPQHLQLITGGKRGMVSIWDLRQQRQVHFFKAHDQAIKCLALDPNEDFFVTGSVAGDIKVGGMQLFLEITPTGVGYIYLYIY